MIRDITLGQYYRADSVVHRLDPRTKLIMTFAYMISLFLFTNVYVYSLAIAFFLVCVYLSKVPLRFMLRGMKPILILLVFTTIVNVLFTSGTVLIKWGIIKITYEGIVHAIYMDLRLVLLVLGANIMTLTTTPSSLTDGLERVLAFLKIFKVPVHEMAMMMSIALRFIPILLEETDRIIKAQMSRGADFENGNIFKRVKCYIPVIIPLFVASFRRANELAMAMEARCYRGGKGRTKYRPLKYRMRDAVAFALMIGYIVGIILLGRL